MDITRRLGTAAIATLLAAGLVACGQDDTSGGTSQAPTPVIVTVSATPADEASPEAGASPEAEAAVPPSQAQATDSPQQAAPATAAGASTPTAVASPTSATTSVASTSGRPLKATITQRSQIATQLAGTSSSFRAYATSRFDLFAKDADACNGGVTLTVDRYWADDLATGSINACGGANTLWWKDSGGTWKEFPLQGVPLCSELTAQGVPASASRAALECFTSSSSSQKVVYGRA